MLSRIISGADTRSLVRNTILSYDTLIVSTTGQIWLALFGLTMPLSGAYATVSSKTTFIALQNHYTFAEPAVSSFVKAGHNCIYPRNKDEVTFFKTQVL